MNTSPVFAQMLHSSMDGFVWAVNQMHPDRYTTRPPKGLGDWSVTQHVFHMVYYERVCALPNMQHWLGGLPYDDATYDEDAAWVANKASLDELLTQFKTIRVAQIALLPQFTPALWQKVGDSVWGRKTPFWIVSKTWQHTNERTNDVMRMVLFWDNFVAYDAEPINND
jgi:hypothetical protein